MDQPTRTIILLCLVGLVKEFRPSESFLSPFLNGPKNFTESQINNDIYPVGTYSHMVLLIIVFLLTDWLKYKPILILQGLSGLVTWSLLLSVREVHLMQLAEVFYGLYCACDVSYSSYMYAKLDKKLYTKATSQTKTAVLVGKTASGLLGQLLILFHIMDFTQLNYLTLGGIVFLIVGASVLPPVSNSTYFHRQESVEKQPPDGPTVGDSLLQTAETVQVSYSLSTVFNLWRKAIQNPHTLKWSIWSALSLAGYLQVSYYIQLLWQAMINSDDNNEIYHGFSNSFNSLAGAFCTYTVGYIKLDWSKYGEVALALSSAAQGGLLIAASYLRSRLLPHYAIYALFKVLYQTSSTIASAEIAKNLESESYALVFGANQFLALIFQSILTLLVTKLFILDIRAQFFLYGGILIGLGVGFGIFSGINRHVNKSS